MHLKKHMSKSERVKVYGSFLFCPKKDTLCSALDNDDGICRKALCYLEDPEYLEEEKQIARRVAENARKQMLEKEAEREAPTTPIRRQIKTHLQALEKRIEKKEASAQRLYRQNKPKAAEIVMREAAQLRGRLGKTKGRCEVKR